MAQADTNRSELRWIEMTDFDTIPATALSIMRITGESLKHNKQTIRSSEIRADRRTGKIAQVGVNATGGVDWELSGGGQFVPLFGGLLFDAGLGWATPNEVTGASDITFSASGKTITSAGAPAFSTKFRVGQYIRVKATVSNGTNSVPKYFSITAVTPTVITVAETVVDEATTSAVISGSTIRNGVTKRYFAIEREAEDLTNVFHSYQGLLVASLALNVEALREITGSFGFLGKSGYKAAATIGTGAHTAATTTDIMTGSVNVGTITEGGSALATALQAISLTLDNNVRVRNALANTAPVGMGAGRCLISGRITAFAEDLALYTKYEAHTQTSLHFRAIDGSGNGYFFTLPAIQFVDDDWMTPRTDEDLMEPLSFENDLSSTYDYDIQIDRFVA